jgi:hypothetical protein
VTAQVARMRNGYGTLEVAALFGYHSHGGVVAGLQRYEVGRCRLARTARRVEEDVTNTTALHSNGNLDSAAKAPLATAVP